MPTIEIHGAKLYYEEHGSGAETVVFAHGLLFDRRIFEHQVAALSERYRVIAFDFRGHGGSEVTRGGYDMDSLAADAAGLIEALGAAPCHFAGLSMGGFVGLRLAARRPELVASLVVLDSSADPEPRENLPKYRLLQAIARGFGLGPVAGRVMPILLGRTTMRDPARREMRELWRARVVGQDRVGVTRAVSGVLERDGVYDLEAIRDEVNRRYFGGRLQVAIAWSRNGRSRSRRPRRRRRRITLKLGSWWPHLRTVRLHPVLDHESVPRLVVASVVHHELLHAELEPEVRNGRRRLHTPEFRRREREFEGHEEARRWIRENLHRLARRRARLAHPRQER